MTNNSVTLDDLAMMVKEGFNEVGERFDKLEKRMDGFEKRMDGFEGRMDKLEKQQYEMQTDIRSLNDGQVRLEKKVDDLIEVVHGVFRVEMIDLKKRVVEIEKRLGIEN